VRAAAAPPQGIEASHQIRSPPSPFPACPCHPFVSPSVPQLTRNRGRTIRIASATRRRRWRSGMPCILRATASTGHVDWADHGALGLIPDRDHLGCRQQLHLAAMALEVGSRLLRQPDPALLPGTDEQPPGPFWRMWRWASHEPRRLGLLQPRLPPPGSAPMSSRCWAPSQPATGRSRSLPMESGASPVPTSRRCGGRWSNRGPVPVGTLVVDTLAVALRASAELRMIIVVPHHPHRDGRVAGHRQAGGRRGFAGGRPRPGERAGTPIYAHGSRQGRGYRALRHEMWVGVLQTVT
jgi:hypothetical protein